jgi:gas vesicle protein
MNMNNIPIEQPRDHRFVIGLLAGAVVGAGLAIWLAPRARNLIKQASDQYDQASARVGDKVDELTRAGNGVRDQMADAVARGAHQVESFAKSVKSA